MGRHVFSPNALCAGRVGPGQDQQPKRGSLLYTYTELHEAQQCVLRLAEREGGNEKKKASLHVRDP